jgi:hypothetical protein
MPTEDRSGTWYANRQRARAIYSQHLIEQQALNQGTANRMNSNGASSGASTVFYAVGSSSGTGEELAAVLQANSAVPPPPSISPPSAPINVTVVQNPPNPGGIRVSWTHTSSPDTLYSITATPGALVFSIVNQNKTVDLSTIDGLVLGTSYTFIVSATNSAGTSPSSSPSAAIQAITFPDPPTNVGATNGDDRQSTVSWTPPIYDGDSTIILYTVTSFSLQDPVTHTVSAIGAVSSSVLVPGLTNAFEYEFIVTATNIFGEGTSSELSPRIKPLGPPSPPLNVFASALDANANVTWEVPFNTGGVDIDLYTITSSPPDFSGTVVPPSLTILANSLTNGTAYTFTVVARNSKGNSEPSFPSSPVTPQGAPNPPTNVIATPGNSSAAVFWTAPLNDGGSPITSYTVTSIPDNKIITTTDTSAEFTGLTNASPYVFTVYATNTIGDSLPSSLSLPIIPIGQPSPPRNPSAFAGNAQALLSWVTPLNDGGSPITSYTVTFTPANISGPQTTVDASTILIVTGLTNNTTYTFTVYATNSMGDSLNSISSVPFTPSNITVPDAPPGISAILVSPGKITVNWAVPVSDGGDTITSYSVYTTPANIAPQSTSSLILDFDNNLINGTSYEFEVLATNSIGNSQLSQKSLPITLIGKPGPVENFTVTPRNTGAILTWNQPLNNGGSTITKYTVNYKLATDFEYTNIDLNSSFLLYNIDGILINGSTYYFYVTSMNSLYTSDSVTPTQMIPQLTVADPPNIISVQAGPGTGEVTIEFAPNIYDGGGTFTSYLIEDPGNAYSTTVLFSSAVLAPLSAGTYQFTVKTVTSVGTSLASASSSSVTVG